MVSRLMKVDIVLRIYSGVVAYATRLVSYVNGLRTPRNNASANALVNVDSRTHCVHKLAYYRHGDVYNIILPTGVVVLFCADAFFRASHLKLLICNVVTPYLVALLA